MATEMGNNKAGVLLLYSPLQHVCFFFYPNYLTYGRVPMATSLKSHKSKQSPPHLPLPSPHLSSPPLPGDGVGSGRTKGVGCPLPWPCDKLIFHLNARCPEHWCKGYYPECPSVLANRAKAACWSTSKKWKVRKKNPKLNTLYLPFLIKWSTVAKVEHIRRKASFVASFSRLYT